MPDSSSARLRRWGGQQSSGQDGSQLRFLAAAMGACTLLERLHKGIIDAAHQQVSHGVAPALLAMLSRPDCLVRSVGRGGPPALRPLWQTAKVLGRQS